MTEMKLNRRCCNDQDNSGDEPSWPSTTMDEMDLMHFLQRTSSMQSSSGNSCRSNSFMLSEDDSESFPYATPEQPEQSHLFQPGSGRNDSSGLNPLRYILSFPVRFLRHVLKMSPSSQKNALEEKEGVAIIHRQCFFSSPHCNEVFMY